MLPDALRMGFGGTVGPAIEEMLPSKEVCLPVFPFLYHRVGLHTNSNVFERT